jgi:hypothetical protein
MYGGVIMKDKYLAILIAIAPLTKKDKNQVWKGVKKDLNLGFFVRIKKLFKLWQALVVVFLSTIFIPLSPSATTILEAETSGWNATLTGENLQIKAVNPMVVPKTKVCVLWVKKNGEIYKIAELPDGGNSKIILQSSLAAKLKNATILISVEDRDDIFYPEKIEYTKEI